MSDFETDTITDVELKQPSQWQVILHNDNYTTVDFVVDVLTTIFHKSVEDAYQLTLEVHKKHSAIAGVYQYDIAITKATETMMHAKNRGFPLKATLQEVE